MKNILNIGIKDFNGSVHELKIRKLFNILTFFGVFTAVFQVALFFEQDKTATLFHSIYGVYCFIAVYLHHLGYFRFAKISTVLIVLIFGTLASARIGSEYYPHIASFGIVGGVFIFFDIKKEWGYLLLFLLLHSAAMILIESDILKNPDIQFENPNLLRTTIVIGVALFIALEFVTVLRLSWLTEKEIISDLKKSNSELKQINDEKTVMLQEIHHRVKNNLQVVISLIKLQSNKVEDKKTVATFEELKMRLISIARMHEMMYLSDKINKIDFKNYVQELSEMVLESTATTKDVELTVNTNIDHLSAEGIVPLALILNELITNSLKHAFNDKTENHISVLFEKTEENHYKLVYSDNGSWKEKKEKEIGFGLELIDLLADQLDGKVKRTTSEEGTKYTFDLII